MADRPWDGRDQQEQAELWYNPRLRRKLKRSEDENMVLKRLLRENGISWSPHIVFPPRATGQQPTQSSTQPGTAARRLTRSSTAAVLAERNVPHLPMEVLFRVLQFSLTSEDPIIDPLSHATHEHQTATETVRRHQFVIQALQVCHAFHIEGNRILWGQNTFVFTSPQALRNFADLPHDLRSQIKQVTLRIVARYYDDEQHKHILERGYHPELKKAINLRVIKRPAENDASRKGFRCYAWKQVIDFLDALQAPFVPGYTKKEPRPRLLPGLESMRMDLVNFLPYYMPQPDIKFHYKAQHDCGQTLNELMVTGLPCSYGGIKAGNDLAGMVKDDGVFMDAPAAFVQLQRMLKPLGGDKYSCKLLRSWKRLEREKPGSVPEEMQSAGHGHTNVPPVPEEEGHPVREHKKRRVLWRKVPATRDSREREWKEFDRRSGLLVDMLELFEDNSDMGEEVMSYCDKCGEFHDQLMFDEDEDGFPF